MHDLEFVTELTEPGGPGEVVSRPATRTPHPTRTGGQDDGSYTNSLKLVKKLLRPLTRPGHFDDAANLNIYQGMPKTVRNQNTSETQPLTSTGRCRRRMV